MHDTAAIMESERASPGPGGPASRWASLTLGMLGVRVRNRKNKLKEWMLGVGLGEVGSVVWVRCRLLSRAAPQSCAVPLCHFQPPDPANVPFPAFK